MATSPTGAVPARGSSRPDPATVDLVGTSARSVLARDPVLVHRVADVAAAGDTRSYPVAGRGELGVEIVHALVVAAAGQVGPDDIEHHWRFLGATAFVTGYPDDGVNRIGHALLRAVRDATDDWSSALSSGWLGYHLWMVSHLADGAEEARAAGLAAAPAVIDDTAKAPAGRAGSGVDELVGAMESGLRRRRR